MLNTPPEFLTTVITLSLSILKTFIYAQYSKTNSIKIKITVITIEIITVYSYGVYMIRVF
ncbi:hypothetical protein M2451_000145 [Dysgonomonas sp. PFB1-18]|nr:hypothetical protein [Dysgonomonas sp. PF1-14]MDH6337614.1 hypothetical protein [Dysgonomonas sp. PF1-16]MDH6378838.1 hypothetical protein [Dysgonomonas sp. PFB1-18]MDH6396473.1 hypothetical protein [Dysgonomonas sp. PF1-23]